MNSREAPFFVLSLPRSRSKWVSEFLSFAGKRCGHDLAVECGSVKEFELAVGQFDGTAETGAVLGWRMLRERWPAAKLVTIHRSAREVAGSFLRAGWDVDLAELAMREQLLLACAQSGGVLSLTFEQLGNFDACEALFGHCLDLGLEWDYWAEMNARNIQIDLSERAAMLQRNAVGLAQLRSEISASRSSTCGLN